MDSDVYFSCILLVFSINVFAVSVELRFIIKLWVIAMFIVDKQIKEFCDAAGSYDCRSILSAGS